MKQMKTLRGSVVTLVTIPKFLPIMMRPGWGEYDHPYVLKTTPCELVKGKYFDLKTGEQIQKAENMIEWRNLSGTAFSFGKDDNLLISRRYSDDKLVLFSLKSNEISPVMILRKMRDRLEEK